MASWVVRSTREQTVPVQALVGGHCDMLLGKALYSHGASLHPGLQFYCWEITLHGQASHSGGVERQKYSWSLYATETGISSGVTSNSARIYGWFTVSRNQK